MDWQAILAIADRLEPEARREFLAAVERVRAQVDVDALARGESLVGPFAEELEPFVEVLRTASREAAEVTASQVRIRVDRRFDLTNPIAIDVARTAGATLVTDITTETQQAIRDAIARGFTDGLTRRDVSKSLEHIIGLNRRQSAALLNLREGLTAEGLAPARVQQLVDRYAAKLLKERAEMIARTEIMRAANVGRRMAWQHAVDRGLLPADQKRRWTLTPDDRLCPYCQAMQDQEQALNEPFVSPLDGRTVSDPPLHPRCRCVAVLAVTRGRLAA